jgi:hypothetical protein
LNFGKFRAVRNPGGDFLALCFVQIHVQTIKIPRVKSEEK